MFPKFSSVYGNAYLSLSVVCSQYKHKGVKPEDHRHNLESKGFDISKYFLFQKSSHCSKIPLPPTHTQLRGYFQHPEITHCMLLSLSFSYLRLKTVSATPCFTADRSCIVNVQQKKKKNILLPLFPGVDAHTLVGKGWLDAFIFQGNHKDLKTLV